MRERNYAHSSGAHARQSCLASSSSAHLHYGLGYPSAEGHIQVSDWSEEPKTLEAQRIWRSSLPKS